MTSIPVRWLVAALLLLWGGAARGQEIQWEPMPPLPELPAPTLPSAPPEIQSDELVWELVPANDSDSPQNHPATIAWEAIKHSVNHKSIGALDAPFSHQTSAEVLVWRAINENELIKAENEETMPNLDSIEETQNTAYQILDSKSPTYSNSRTLWRNGRWHPQITHLIPNGFGPEGLMLEVNATGTDCSLGKGPCKPFSSLQDWINSLETQANGNLYLNAGFGSPLEWGSFLITNSLESVPADLKSSGGVNSNPFQSMQTGLHYSKAVGPNTSFRTGVENLITWNNNDLDADQTRNFYLVASQKIPLKDPKNTSPWLRNIYLTAGIGNGEFKPIEQTFQDQTQALKDAGCTTYGYAGKTCDPSSKQFKRAIRDGSDYGPIHPLASVGLEVFDGFHLISEWTGRNLNAGFSWRPFKDLGFILTPMVESIVRNCEYPGCEVEPLHNFPEKVPLPDSVLTDRVRLSLQASFQIKF